MEAFYMVKFYNSNDKESNCKERQFFGDGKTQKHLQISVTDS